MSTEMSELNIDTLKCSAYIAKDSYLFIHSSVEELFNLLLDQNGFQDKKRLLDACKYLGGQIDEESEMHRTLDSILFQISNVLIDTYSCLEIQISLDGSLDGRQKLSAQVYGVPISYVPLEKLQDWMVFDGRTFRENEVDNIETYIKSEYYTNTNGPELRVNSIVPLGENIDPDDYADEEIHDIDYEGLFNLFILPILNHLDEINDQYIKGLEKAKELGFNSNS